MRSPSVERAAGLSRGSTTWLLYGVFSCMAFLLNGLGAVLAPLRADLGVSRGDVTFYPTLFAIGLIAVGLGGGEVVSRVGRAATLRLSLAGMVLGGLLLATPERVPTLLGTLLLGTGAAFLIQLTPTLLAALHPHAATAAVGEANGLASATSVLAPLAVGGAISAGLGWRAGYLAAPLMALAVGVLPTWRIALPTVPTSVTNAAAGAAEPLLGRWLDVLLAVSVEFCIVFWAASALIEWHHASAGQGPAVASLFLVGMAIARGMAVPITRRLPGPRRLVLACIAVAAAGFSLFWLAPGLGLAGAGLTVTGLGVALLYPTSVSRVIAAWPHAPDRAAGRAALASGLAIGGAPFLLARLSDATGLHTAYLIVPALLLLLAARGATAIRSSPRPGPRPCDAGRSL